MGLRTVYSILKGIERDDVRAAIDEAIAVMPPPKQKSTAWSDYPYVVAPRSVVAAHEHDVLVFSDQAWILASEIAARRNLVWMELRAQEGDHWDFTLHTGRELVADFSTFVGAFEDDPDAPRPWKAGGLAGFAGVAGQIALAGRHRTGSAGPPAPLFDRELMT